MDSAPIELPDLDLIFESRLFKILGEPIRVEIIRYLAVHGVCDVGTVAKEFPQDRSVISRHLRLMAEVGLLFRSKRGRNAYYSLNGFEFLKAFEDAASSVRTLLSKVCPVQFERYERTGEIPEGCEW